jgi:hypothetical protein
MRIIGVDLGLQTGLALAEYDASTVRYFTLCYPSDLALEWVKKNGFESFLVMEDFPILKSAKLVKVWLLELLKDYCKDGTLVQPAKWKQGIRPFKHLIPKRQTRHEWDALAMTAWAYAKLHYQKIWELSWEEWKFNDEN